jgi:chromosome segregation ATPase
MSLYKELISEKGRNIQDLVESLQEVKLRMSERVGHLEEKLTTAERSKAELEEQMNSCNTTHEQAVETLEAQLQDFKKAVLQLEDEKDQLQSRINLVDKELSGCKIRNEELDAELDRKSEEAGTKQLVSYYTFSENEERVSGKGKGCICQSVKCSTVQSS